MNDLYLTPSVRQDMTFLASLPLPFEQLTNKHILITGANGMLATYLVYFFHYLRTKHNIPLHLTATSRSAQRLHERFGNLADREGLQLEAWDITQSITYEQPVDILFHFAGDASPSAITNDPAGILDTNLTGTLRLLQLARCTPSCHFLYASTREVYGRVEGKTLLREEDFGICNPTEPRSCYPESKRAAEALLTAFGRQYGLRCNAIRMAHVYGPGMKLKDDGRIMSDLLCDYAASRDITLHSTGQVERAFCYLGDAISAILFILMKGTPGQPYNLSNEDEPLPILLLAEQIAMLNPAHPLKVRIDVPKEVSTAYCNYRRTGLDTSRLRALGWSPSISLLQGLKRTAATF